MRDKILYFFIQKQDAFKLTEVAAVMATQKGQVTSILMVNKYSLHLILNVFSARSGCLG